MYLNQTKTWCIWTQQSCWWTCSSLFIIIIRLFLCVCVWTPQNNTKPVWFTNI